MRVSACARAYAHGLTFLDVVTSRICMAMCTACSFLAGECGERAQGGLPPLNARKGQGPGEPFCSNIFFSFVKINENVDNLGSLNYFFTLTGWWSLVFMTVE